MLIAVASVAVVVAVLVGALAPRLAWRRLVRRRVMVVHSSGRSFEGVLWARRGPLLVLRNASVSEAGVMVEADGEVVIERSHVAWLQVLG